jgi:lipopolysaccharide/colanic/teichoic acid biosynthesis glycosyltransferase
MTGEVPRMQVFEEIAASCLHLPVRLRELSGFYEEVFGHVAVAEINAAWFQWIVHPKYRAGHSLGERVLDLVVAAVVGVVALPLLGLLALIIRRDGGPALFRQPRIGEGGREFTILKLRTMRVGAPPEWATESDTRVTAIGRFLRRTHLDELPQILNVLRGEMSIVGPRPEQPEFVDRLEQVVPFYQRRHLMKPGITGWAQVRCGYAGSEVGSAWKVCHDLYYLKHRSLSLNLVILAETLRTLVADPQYSAEPQSVHFILAPTETPIDVAAAAAAAS